CFAEAMFDPVNFIEVKTQKSWTERVTELGQRRLFAALSAAPTEFVGSTKPFPQPVYISWTDRAAPIPATSRVTTMILDEVFPIVKGDRTWREISYAALGEKLRTIENSLVRPRVLAAPARLE